MKITELNRLYMNWQGEQNHCKSFIELKFPSISVLIDKQIMCCMHVRVREREEPLAMAVPQEFALSQDLTSLALPPLPADVCGDSCPQCPMLRYR
jgi:hypothetical protein